MKRKPNGYWNIEITINEIKKIINKLGYFPSTSELLLIGRGDLIHAINRHGGIQKIRLLFGYSYKRKAHNAYTKEQMKEFDLELENIYNINNKLTSTMLRDIGRNDLINYIGKKGGHIIYAEEKGIPHMKESGYWNKEENILLELNSLIVLLGHFPSSTELSNFNCTLRLYISKHGGINKFRQILGYIPHNKSIRFWTEGNILSCLQALILKTGNYPTTYAIQKEFGNGILLEMQRIGGMNYFRKKMGYIPSTKERISNYSNIKGRLGEWLIEEILDECCIYNGLAIIKNKKFSDNSIIEFYLIHDKSKATACIDITCTDKYENIINKWVKRKYHEYSDIVMIVVFSNSLKEKDYEYLNKICPKNVYVVEVLQFIDSLKYKYNNVSVEDINYCKSYTFDKYMKDTYNR